MPNPIPNRLRPPPRTVGLNEADRSRLPSCSDCHLPAFGAFKTPHGCRLCGFCWGRLACLERLPCPGARKHHACRGAVKFHQDECSPDQEARLQLSGVFIECWNSSSGCLYIMPYMKLSTHEAQECQFKLVSCTGCHRNLLRRDLGDHQRSDECRQILIANLGNYGVPNDGDNMRIRPPPRTVGLNEADRSRLPSCSDCHLPAFGAFKTPHGCRLCGFCWGRLACLERLPCPGARKHHACQNAVKFHQDECSPDQEARLQLSCVFVECWNSSRGCLYIMPYMKLSTHEAQECQFKLVSCTGCHRNLLRRDLGDHQHSDECRQFLIANLGNYGVPNDGDN
uniref:TRAF-type domain-containing protein n=1 Tax=Macrostomum lignano TaxID=282301 RepID=A0A1I8GJ82_9PLAT